LRPLGPADETRIGVSIGFGLVTDLETFPAALEAADVELYERKSARLAREPFVCGTLGALRVKDESF
jgi:hypothetical protein